MVLESSAFDIIFAGGGTTACVIAGRLMEIDPSLKILVIESGQHTRDVPNHVQPCRFVEHLTPESSSVSWHVGKPSVHLNGRSATVPAGRCVGGGSAVNFMAYVRGAASDYDDWAALGNKGWSFNELLPLIKKIETFTPIAGRPTHGYSGPIQISAVKTNLGIGDQFLKVGREYDSDRPQADDHNDFKTPNGYSRVHSFIDAMTGKRSDPASRYLYPHSDNPNLQVLVGKRVKRVVIENGRAVGVEYTSDARSQPDAIKELVTVKATKLVVVSAGTFGSPCILERSGIGSPSVLRKHHLQVIVDLPGVGEHYQDHYGVVLVNRASDDMQTMDDMWSNPDAIIEWSKEWERNGSGKVAHNGIEAMVKLRPMASQVASSGLALQSRWDTFFEKCPDKPMAIIGVVAGCPQMGGAIPGLVGNKYISVAYYILYPELAGSVHITSGEDANALLDFDPDYFSKPSDIAQLTLFYKMARERARRMPAYRGEVIAAHPEYPAGSAATYRETDIPASMDAPDIMYSKADDEAIVEFHRERISSSWHSLGTCAMKPRNQGGVVDERLNVYGVDGLKVADLSICPTNVANNTCSTALLIGEKAATIIAEDFGIEPRHLIDSEGVSLAGWSGAMKASRVVVHDSIVAMQEDDKRSNIPPCSALYLSKL